MKRHTLLCVDDDPGIREFYETLFRSQGYEVIVAGGGPEALKLFHSKKKIDAVIADYDMPEMNGAELAAELKRCAPRLPVIMISGCTPVVEAAPHVVDAAMEKGAPVDTIMDRVKNLLATRRAGPTPIPVSRYVPLGSALTGVATAAFFLAKFLR